MAKSTHFFIRRSHRYLGLLLGLQFLLWTIGGLYFSWSKMDEIHGDFQKKKVPLLKSDLALVSPSIVLDSIKKGVSDIHLEPFEKKFRIRFRADGICVCGGRTSQIHLAPADLQTGGILCSGQERVQPVARHNGTQHIEPIV